MKKLFSLLSILLLLGFFPTIYGQTTERTAVIVDQSGTSTELETLSIERGLGNKYYDPDKKLAVITETFEVLIPVSNLISIEYIGGGRKNKRQFDVSYYWVGEKKMITGNLTNITLTGKGDFGKLSLSSNELKQLRVSQIPDEIKQAEEFHFAGYITLRDGAKLEFGSRSTKMLLDGSPMDRYALNRQVGYSTKYKKTLPENIEDKMSNQRRYEWADQTQNSYSRSIAFDRGKSQGSVEFEDLKSIEFEGKDNRDIILTLKNGKSTKAQINVSNDHRDFQGLVGESGKGEFYIERKNIRNIYFYE